MKNIETIKTIVIAILVTMIAAFPGGMLFQNHLNGQVKAEAVGLAKQLNQNQSK